MGTITVTADRDWANVQIRAGNAVNPAANQLVRQGPFGTGDSYTGDDGAQVCYSRERIPGNAGSGQAGWVCNQATTSTNETYTVE